MFQRAIEGMKALRADSKKRRARRQRDSVKLRPEALEDRRLLCTVSTTCITQTGSELVINGTAEDDRIILYAGDGGLVVSYQDGSAGTTNEHGPYYYLSNITINGLAGDDVITASTNVSQTMTLNGGDGNDYLAGGGQDDLINGDDDDDDIHGANGNDTLNGGNGDEEIRGREGDDTIQGNAGEDDISGGDGNDTIYGDDMGAQTTGDDDRIDGGTGDDLLHGNGGNDNISGGSGADILVGDDGNDDLYGRQGNDVIIGGAQGDNLQGNGGHDVLAGGDYGAGLTDSVLDSYRAEMASANTPATKHSNIQMGAGLATAPLDSSNLIDDGDTIDGHTSGIGADLTVAHQEDRNYRITGDDTITVI